MLEDPIVLLVDMLLLGSLARHVGSGVYLFLELCEGEATVFRSLNSNIHYSDSVCFVLYFEVGRVATSERGMLSTVPHKNLLGSSAE